LRPRDIFEAPGQELIEPQTPVVRLGGEFHYG
jgi:hypothetical protein